MKPGKYGGSYDDDIVVEDDDEYRGNKTLGVKELVFKQYERMMKAGSEDLTQAENLSKYFGALKRLRHLVTPLFIKSDNFISEIKKCEEKIESVRQSYYVELVEFKKTKQTFNKSYFDNEKTWELINCLGELEQTISSGLNSLQWFEEIAMTVGFG